MLGKVIPKGEGEWGVGGWWSALWFSVGCINADRVILGGVVVAGRDELPAPKQARARFGDGGGCGVDAFTLGVFWGVCRVAVGLPFWE